MCDITTWDRYINYSLSLSILFLLSVFRIPVQSWWVLFLHGIFHIFLRSSTKFLLVTSMMVIIIRITYSHILQPCEYYYYTSGSNVSQFFRLSIIILAWNSYSVIICGKIFVFLIMARKKEPNLPSSWSEWNKDANLLGFRILFRKNLDFLSSRSR